MVDLSMLIPMSYVYRTAPGAVRYVKEFIYHEVYQGSMSKSSKTRIHTLCVNNIRSAL